MSNLPLKFRLATPANPGALAVFDVVGDIDSVLPLLMRTLGGKTPDIAVGKIRLVQFIDETGEIIDTGIVARPANMLTQLMPHGGLRIIRKIFDSLINAGVSPVTVDDWSPGLWPEADSYIEALMLETLSTAASTDAIDPLIAQPKRWQPYYDNDTKRYGVPEVDWRTIRRSSRIFKRLITPPAVVITGPANTGKSTLTNALTGRSTSITLDQPGTTRDFVGSSVDLAGLTVSWFDTPGLRRTDDAVEAEAMRLSRQLIDNADLIIEAWSPDVSSDSLSVNDPAPRACDLRIMLKADLSSRNKNETSEQINIPGFTSTTLSLSAQTGEGVEELVRTIRDKLVPREIHESRLPFIFNDLLLSMVDIIR